MSVNRTTNLVAAKQMPSDVSEEYDFNAVAPVAERVPDDAVELFAADFSDDNACRDGQTPGVGETHGKIDTFRRRVIRSVAPPFFELCPRPARMFGTNSYRNHNIRSRSIVCRRERHLIPTGATPLGVTPAPTLLWKTETVYNAAGQVVKEIDQNGLITEYTYDVRGQQTEVRSQSAGSNGQIVWSVQRTVYDAAGRAIYRNSFVEGTPLTQIYGSHSEYDGDGRSVRSEQLLGLVIEIGEYGQSHVKSTGIVLSSSATVYNNAGWIISSIDTYNLETGYTYNVFGETTQTRRELVDGRWMVSERVYDSQGRVVFSTDSHVEGSTDPIYGTRTIYDAQGRVEKTVRYVGCQVAVTADGTSTVVSYGNVLYQTSTEYDSKGRVKSSIDAYGNVTTYEYDNLDRQVAVNQETLGLRSETVYNKQGQVEKTVSNIKIEADKSFDYSDTIVSVNTYNMYGQVVKTVTDGRIVEYEYDDLGRQTAMIDHQTVDGVSHRTETVYDDLGRVVLSRTNVKQFADGTIDRSEAQEQQYVYDARGNVVKTIFADGTTISAAYNDQGQKVSETNQLGQTRHFEYDIKGRLIAVVLPAVVDPITNQMVSPRYEYQYDDFGRQTLLRDPNGYETRFTYDAFGNQATRTLPLGFGADGIQGTEDDDILPEGDFTEKSYYDDNGRLFMQISFEGVITTFSYDNYGRVHQKFFWESLTAYAEGTQPAMEVWTYTYDSQGRVTCVDQNGRKTETTYDLLGRVASIKTPEGTVSYEYDKFGRQTRVSSDKGDDVRYSYDIFGRLHTVTDATTGSVTTYDYDLVGTLARTTTDTGLALLVTQYQYDNMNRLIKLTHFRDDNRDGKMDSGEEISQFDYLLDAQGRKIQADEKFWVDSQVKNNKVNWTYDSAGRLIREVFDHYDDAFDQTSDWIYDLVGNRLQQTVNGNVTTYDYDVNDRLLYEIFGEKETFYGYDQTQQTSKVVTESGTLVSETTFEYDLQGRMAVVTTVNGNRTEIVKYEYGADGIRTSAENEVYVDGELVSKTRTEYLNDSRSLTGYSQVLRQTEYDAGGNVIKETSYVIGHQRISQTVEIDGQKEQYFFTFDGHGSTRVLLDTALAVAQIYSFDAYGNALGFNPSEALTEFLYSGEQFDAKIGQQYLRARYYDPATGRFNRLDPFFGNQTDPQSFHKYLYCHADPIQGVDPSGNFFSIPVFFAGQAICTGLRNFDAFASQNVGAAISFSAICAAMFAAHIVIPEVLDNANFQSDSYLPDAAILGIAGTSRSMMERLENFLIHTGTGPMTPFIGHPMDLLGMLSRHALQQPSAVGAIEIVMNIKSAQMTVFASFGLQTSSIFGAPPTDNNMSIYSGLIFNLPNNQKYMGMGINVACGPMEFFSDLGGSYFGVAAHRNIIGNSTNAIGIANAAPIPGLSWNFPTCHASVAMATAWGGLSMAMVPGAATLTSVVGSAAVAGYWAYAKWTPSDLLPQVQNQ